MTVARIVLPEDRGVVLPVALPGDRGAPLRAAPVFAPYVAAGVLVASDVHVAQALLRVLQPGGDDPLTLLGAAFAVRAPRVGHSCLDVDDVAASIVDELPSATDDRDDVDLFAGLPWPDRDAWLAAIQSSPLAVPGPGQEVAPLIVEGRRVFLRRLWEQESAVATALRTRAATSPAAAAEGDALAESALLDRLFTGGEPGDPQRRAAEVAGTNGVTVVAGGPGTGKTWTVARILAVLIAQHGQGDGPLEIALAAPTGKAAARLDEGLREATAEMDVPVEVAEALAQIPAGRTLHSLLGRRTNARFWHDRAHPLPHDVVVVDETSMASLSLMAGLLAAVRPEATLVLVGDPFQLQAVEAGSVLSDVVTGLDGVVTLTRPHRFGADSGIGTLARAIHGGDADRVIDLLRAGGVATEGVPDLEMVGHEALEGIRAGVVDRGARLRAAALEGDVDAARGCLDELVVLCAHRRGDDGVAGWNRRVDRWLASAVPGWQQYDPWQPGRAVLATVNDRPLHVFNGDLGVVVARPDGMPAVAFHGTSSGRLPILPARLEGLESVHAMTIHKSQGSQWRHVVVVLPQAASRILTRELLYTAATRASQRLTVVGDEATIRHAVGRPVKRASNLAARLRAT